ncbi:hypothetical protein AAHA92_04058 [Salvia divinorum]|uniref:Uncharacterized protein n=1 Tax=Salvia divinorum TaxID=28513 RepID=A0ABD1I202_SALDI
MEVAEQQHHIVMLPFMAQGHLMPYLALANQIARRFAFTITIATTPLNVRHLQATAAQPSPGIHFVALPFKLRRSQSPAGSGEHRLPASPPHRRPLPCLHLPRTPLPRPNPGHHRPRRRPSALHNF